MNDICKIFLERLLILSPVARGAFLKCVDYWKPDKPPITTVFGEVGQAIVENFDSIEPQVRADIMTLIEQGALSEDEQLSTAVYTGMIEAMIGAAQNTNGRAEALLRELGPRSKWHANIWRNG